jgi:hypothetical protein
MYIVVALSGLEAILFYLKNVYSCKNSLHETLKVKKRLFICWYQKIENLGQFCRLYLGFIIIIIIINFPIIWCLIGR